MEDFLINDYDLLEEKANILKAIAHPIRLCILRGLSEKDEGQVSDMTNCLNMPQSTISQHVGILKKEGLLKGRRDGTKFIILLKMIILEI
ncbi:ArsR/SmtB family transcription factor [Peptoniphilus stercorisuis]|uniref:ArsR family transcriptional regulator n=1 Tax=Peptoniphilus stercorisuis TaxID=1436965 RepID=A0ABS4KEK3_9FIRM|nr:metalloregulator ArsR/SmtB family transcription factor [Peptoniphilus stercorisuis]MBP2026193.1 ArsR family transcriptional regulator [Peptoniphilus stercorisuis]